MKQTKTKCSLYCAICLELNLMIATASATTATKKGNKNILCCVTKVLVAAQEVLVY